MIKLWPWAVQSFSLGSHCYISKNVLCVFLALHFWLALAVKHYVINIPVCLVLKQFLHCVPIFHFIIFTASEPLCLHCLILIMCRFCSATKSRSERAACESFAYISVYIPQINSQLYIFHLITCSEWLLIIHFKKEFCHVGFKNWPKEQKLLNNSRNQTICRPLNSNC